MEENALVFFENVGLIHLHIGLEAIHAQRELL